MALEINDSLLGLGRGDYEVQAKWLRRSFKTLLRKYPTATRYSFSVRQLNIHDVSDTLDI